MGRDRGRLFVVVGIGDDRRVLVADGVVHKAARPKRKNVSHVILLRQIDDGIAARLRAGLAVSDPELVTALRVYRPEDERRGDPVHV
ncbi:MAG: KOW domain-containing RNA-binding protein [Clostridia bacterium]|nr:KOW domain-containing RNA-binding protein [Clostridia bacterium]